MEFFLVVFEYHHMFILILGLLLGILVGSLPGLTPTMGVALMIPFTFSLGATDGLIILGGIYCGSVYGGSIPAILFNVPGAPASVATTFDGYPMTEQGKARKALELATISSVIGGLFGIFLLMFFAPIFANFSLQFGPGESFWIALFGITVIAAISDGSINKNLIGGCLGILISFIGISTVTGTARFTFGSDSLIGGLHIVAVLIGLFAFPQALRLIAQLRHQERKDSPKYSKTKSSIRQSFKDICLRPKAVTMGSGIGAFIGMIPGVGGNIASILAYNEVKRFSKDKSNFGMGEPKGVIASESANNAMVGGSLIPLLTLGIPGSPTAAIFLGGLLIHGIWPGRDLFVNHAGVAYTFLYSMLIAQILLLILGLSLIKYMTRLTHIPAYIMAPVIISFSIIGAYTTQNNVFDIYTVVVIGMVMYLLQKHNFSPAPIALGFILGTIAEEGFLQGLQLGGARGSVIHFFFTGGWNILLYSMIILTVAISLIQTLRRLLKKDKTYPTKKRKLTLGNILSKDVLICFGLIIVGAGSFYLISDLAFQLRIFPQVTLTIMIVLFIIEFIKAVNNNLTKKRISTPRNRSLSLLMLMLFVIIISLLINIIGFYTQIFLLMTVVPLVVYFKKWNGLLLKSIFITSIAFTFVLYIIFSVILNVPIPMFPML